MFYKYTNSFIIYTFLINILKKSYNLCNNVYSQWSIYLDYINSYLVS